MAEVTRSISGLPPSLDTADCITCRLLHADRRARLCRQATEGQSLWLVWASQGAHWQSPPASCKPTNSEWQAALCCRLSLMVKVPADCQGLAWGSQMVLQAETR